MNKWLEILLGLILVIVPVVLLLSDLALWEITWKFVVGGIIVGVILIGVMFVMLGISDINSK